MAISNPQATDPYAEAVEIGVLMQQVRELKAECRRHAGNVVEAAVITGLDRSNLRRLLRRHSMEPRRFRSSTS